MSVLLFPWRPSSLRLCSAAPWLPCYIPTSCSVLLFPSSLNRGLLCSPAPFVFWSPALKLSCFLATLFLPNFLFMFCSLAPFFSQSPALMFSCSLGLPISVLMFSRSFLTLFFFPIFCYCVLSLSRFFALMFSSSYSLLAVCSFDLSLLVLLSFTYFHLFSL